MEKKYKYRNLPSTISTDEKLWCVVGKDNFSGGAGVLEWCYDSEDAFAILAEMKKFSNQFSNLKAGPWNGE